TRILLLTLLLPAFLSAQETDGFQTDLQAGFTLTDGNSETTVLNMGIASKNIKEKQETLLSASYDYGRTTNTDANGVETESTNLDRGKLEGQSNWLLSKDLYTFYNLTAEKDERANVDYRVNNGPGFGYYFLRTDEKLLSTETSIVYVMEEVGGVQDDYAAFRLAQRAELTFSDGARIWQSFEGILSFSDTDNYFLTAELGAEAKLHARLALRVVLKDKYDNQPDSNVEKNDLTIFSGISVKL
ncbi:MAG: DUF481 domain-containing protein, partial [Kiritimatiellia bacterium]